jgi:hypothetical protein
VDAPDILTALAAAISKADEAHDINGSREPFLRVIFKFLRPNAKAAIGLWLIDTEGAKEIYEATLWQVVHSNLAGPGVKAVSARVPIEKNILRQDFDFADQRAIHAAFPITIEHGGIWRYLPAKWAGSNEPTGTKAGATSAGSANFPSFAARIQPNRCCGVRSYRRAISATTAPGATASATIRPFSSFGHRRFRPMPVRISTRPRPGFVSTISSTIYAKRPRQISRHRPPQV